jgi:hypothetical protein
MRRYKLSTFISEAVKGIYRNPLSSTVSIISLVLALLVMGTFWLLKVNIDYNLETLGDFHKIVVYLELDASEQDAENVRSKIREYIGVSDSDIEFISKEQALLNEKEKYGVEILPLRFTYGEEEYLDGVDLSLDDFYHKMIDEKLFPKTSLPSLGEAEERITQCTESGDDVLVITMSSGLSGTYNTFKMLFEDNPRVLVIDSKSCVGGERILVMEANKYRDQSLDFIKEIRSNLEASL